MKKLLPLLLLAFLLLGCTKETPEPLFNPEEAQSGERTSLGTAQEQNFHYELFSDNTATLTDYDSSKGNKSVVIPDRYQHYKITVIEKECFRESSVSHITLPQFLERIEDRAFQRSALEEITLPDSLLHLGEEAFDNCLSLKKVTFGSGLSEIFTGTFFGCEKLEELVLPENIKVIGEEAFAGLTSLNRLSLSEGLLEIGDYAFWKSGTDSLSFSIPQSVIAIGLSAFEETPWLKFQTEPFVFVGNGILITLPKGQETVTLPEETRYLAAKPDAATQVIHLSKNLTGFAEGALDSISNDCIFYSGTNPDFLSLFSK